MGLDSLEPTTSHTIVEGEGQAQFSNWRDGMTDTHMAHQHNQKVTALYILSGAYEPPKERISWLIRRLIN